MVHTCSEISYRITDVECIVRAKNTPVNLTGEIGRPYVENSAKLLSTSLLKGMFWCSFVSREKSKDKQIVATVQKRNWKQIDVPVLGLAGCHWRGNWNGVAGTSPGVPGDILGSYEELRWMEPHMSSPSPCTRFKKGRGQKEEKREVLHLFRCYTHTPKKQSRQTHAWIRLEYPGHK